MKREMVLREIKENKRKIFKLKWLSYGKKNKINLMSKLQY